MSLIKKVLFFLFPWLFKEKDNFNLKETEKEIIYNKKMFMTNSEISFYKKLIEIEKLNYKVIPQINLGTIVKKISNSKYRNELYRNIDFAIFDENWNILLLIELNDESHNKKSRIDRDLKVKKICNDAGINLIKFYTKYPNEKDYIINRILKEVKK